jgi:hypothetical protein
MHYPESGSLNFLFNKSGSIQAAIAFFFRTGKPLFRLKRNFLLNQKLSFAFFRLLTQKVFLTLSGETGEILPEI